MKKEWAVFVLIGLAVMPAAAASIAVQTPVAGDNWVIGSSHTITWTSSGVTGPVDVILRPAGAPAAPPTLGIAAGTANDGSVNWTIPASVTPGDYLVRIRSVNTPAVFGDSGNLTLSKLPTIMDPPFKTIPRIEQARYPCLAVTAPKKGDSCDPYNIVKIKWNRNGTQDANVSITLLRSGKGHLMGETKLAASTPNNGAFDWDPVSLMPAPGAYTLRVRTLDGKCVAYSEEFKIPEVGNITLLSPLGGEKIENSTSFPVTWKSLGNTQTVDILLTRASSTYKTLAQGVNAKLGTMNCVFVRNPNDQGSPCHYNLFLNPSGGGSSNMSNCFYITGNPDLVVGASFSPTMANVGTDLTFTITIENKGAGRSQPCLGDFRANGTVLQTFPVPAIDPGATATVTVKWKLACPAKITINVDKGGANIEKDKANNYWEKPIC
jgi:hypothetical protein